uniref:Putative secreted peptide n=1 Tax=Anopheles braziliensis TaxID=58242 RepID=A0A2M3ZSR8_9DIPT
MFSFLFSFFLLLCLRFKDTVQCDEGEDELRRERERRVASGFVHWFAGALLLLLLAGHCLRLLGIFGEDFPFVFPRQTQQSNHGRKQLG